MPFTRRLFCFLEINAFKFIAHFVILVIITYNSSGPKMHIFFELKMILKTICTLKEHSTELLLIFNLLVTNFWKLEVILYAKKIPMFTQVLSNQMLDSDI